MVRRSYKKCALQVAFVFHVDDIPEVDDEKQTLHMTMYLTMKWKEPRITVKRAAANETGVSSRKGRENLWFPDVGINGWHGKFGQF